MDLQYSKNKLYALFALLTVNGAFTVSIRGKRPTNLSLERPCNVSEELEPVTTAPFKQSIGDLTIQFEDLKDEVRRVKTFIKSNYGISDAQASSLDSLENFMERERMIAGDEQRAAAINQPIQALKGSYSLLQELFYYVDYIRKKGKIASTLEAATEELKTRLFRCLCNVKIALRSSQTDVVSNVTSVVFSYYFRVTMEKNKVYESYRAYIVMGDSDRLMEFLSIIYSAIEQETV